MKRHPLDPISLVFALLFITVAIRFLAAGADADALPRIGWLVPVAVIAVGAMIVASAVRDRSPRDGS